MWQSAEGTSGLWVSGEGTSGLCGGGAFPLLKRRFNGLRAASCRRRCVPGVTLTGLRMSWTDAEGSLRPESLGD